MVKEAINLNNFSDEILGLPSIEKFIYGHNILYYNMQKSTMAITKETKEQLDKLKVHPREPYEDVIKRLLERCK